MRAVLDVPERSVMRAANHINPASWDPPAPRPARKGYLTQEQIDEQHARCLANYQPPSALQRLLDRVPDFIATECNGCGKQIRAVLGGSMECRSCGTREVDELREELEAATSRAQEAQDDYEREAKLRADVERALEAADALLDQRANEIERLTARLAKLEGEGYP